MPGPKKKTTPLRLYGFIALNLFPLLGILLHWFEQQAALYAYAEIYALLGVTALFRLYAKQMTVFLVMVTGSILMQYVIYGPDNLKTALAFWILYSLCWLVYIELGRSSYGQAIYRLHPTKRAGLYLGYMAVSGAFCMWLTTLVYQSFLPAYANETAFDEFFVGFAVAMPTFSLALLRIINMIGPRQFLDFIAGTYYRPAERSRVVFFLDIAGSTGIAELIGAKDSMSLLSHFIFDACRIIRINGGDIMNTTGDGLVVLWPRHQADRALAAAMALRGYYWANRPVYMEKFGVIPDFRIGIHAGEIIISQIGEEKLFLAVYGDVVNIASRLEQMNKELRTKVLVSKDCFESMSPASQARLKPMNAQNIKGRYEGIEVFALKKDDPNARPARETPPAAQNPPA